ncbi:MAG: hypothetical protein E7311_03205 [Clostridiales bacterium]|nr:hypothetical protein [Clostridiales bacterium]
MKKLSLKLNSEQRFHCKVFEIFLKENEEGKIVLKPSGKAVVIQETNEVILMLNANIKLTEKERAFIEHEISKVYTTAQEIGFVVNLVSRDIEISME